MTLVRDLEVKEISLSSKLPYWSFQDGVIVGVDGSYTAGFKLEGLDVRCWTDDELNHQSLKVRAMLNALPQGVRLQFIVDVNNNFEGFIDEYSNMPAKGGPVSEFLRSARVEDLRKRRLFGYDIYLYYSISLSFTKKFSLSFKKTVSVAEADHEKAIDKLTRIKNIISGELLKLKMGYQALTDKDNIGIVYKYLNPGRCKTLEAPKIMEDEYIFEGIEKEDIRLRPLTAREQLCFSPLIEEKDFLLLDNNIIRVISMKSKPEDTVPSIILDLLSRPSYYYRCVVNIVVPDNQLELMKLKIERNIATTMSGGTGDVKNIEELKKKEQIEDMIEEMLDTLQRFFYVSISVVLSSELNGRDFKTAFGELEDQTQDVLRKFSYMRDAEGIVDSYTQLKSFLGTLPAGYSNAMRSYVFQTNTVADLLPLYSDWKGMVNPIVVVENFNSGLTGLDFRKASSSKHQLTVATTGSGKSVFRNFNIVEEYNAGIEQKIIDSLGSYRKLMECMGGTYVDINPKIHRINPLIAYDEILDEGVIDFEKINDLKLLLEVFLLEHRQERLSNRELLVLEKCLIKTYAKAIEDKKTPVLEDLHLVLSDFDKLSDDKKDIDLAKGLSRQLDTLLGGMYGKLFNGETSFEYNPSLCCFDLARLKNDVELQKRYLMVIANKLFNDRGSLKPTVFTLDEVWKLLQMPEVARLINSFVREGRKRNITVHVISQGLEEFVDDSIDKGIINNLGIKYFLRFDQGQDVVAKFFKLSEREEEIFRTLETRAGEYSEVYAKIGTVRIPFRVRLPKELLWISTTKPEELLKEREYKEKHPKLSQWEIIKKLAEDYPNGV